MLLSLEETVEHRRRGVPAVKLWSAGAFFLPPQGVYYPVRVVTHFLLVVVALCAVFKNGTTTQFGQLELFQPEGKHKGNICSQRGEREEFINIRCCSCSCLCSVYGFFFSSSSLSCVFVLVFRPCISRSCLDESVASCARLPLCSQRTRSG